MKLTPTVIKNLDNVALLAGLALFLSTVEYMIPKPIPFMRLGLPILISLPLLPVPYLLLLILLRVLGQALIQGSLFSYIFLFSLTGSVTSGLVMLLLYKTLKRGMSLVGISILGALASNLSQSFLAVHLVFGESGWLVAPLLMGIGLGSSVLLGIFAQKFSGSSEWVKLTLHRE